MTRRVLVCGGRTYGIVPRDTPRDCVRAASDKARREWNLIWEMLDTLHVDEPIGTIIEGGAEGADRAARRWAERKAIAVETFAADWKTYGRAAGPMRNARMISEGRPDLVVAFPGGDGTLSMISQAARAGIRVIEVDRAS